MRMSWVCVLSVGAATVDSSALAQGQTSEHLAPVKVQLPSARPAGEGETFDLEFKGGSVQEYVEAIHAAARERKIVVMPDTERFRVPPVKLTGVTMQSAVRILDGTAIQERGTVSELRVRENSGTWVVSPIFGAKREPQVMAKVWTVAPLVDGGVAADDVLAAVEASLALGEQNVEVKFHQPTRLLIARGVSEQLATIEQVLDRLRDGVYKPPAPDGEKAQALERQIADLQMALNECHRRAEAAKERIEEAEKRRQVAEETAHRLRDELAAQHQRGATEMARMEVRLQDAEGRAKRFEAAWLELEKQRVRREIELEKAGVKPAGGG